MEKIIKIIKYRFYNEQTKKIEYIDILGYCSYCKDPILVTEEYRMRRNQLFHSECFAQMRR